MHTVTAYSYGYRTRNRKSARIMKHPHRLPLGPLHRARNWREKSDVAPTKLREGIIVSSIIIAHRPLIIIPYIGR
eukprot:scaffold162142_cov49-Prasinocladus_malaysianus.AAC.1